jgi:hypothetical protein
MYNIYDLFELGISIFFIFICFILIIIWPITQFILGIIFQHKLVCVNDTSIKLENWLIVNSLITILIEIFIIALWFTGKDSAGLKTLDKIISLFISLLLVCVCVGSYIFWFECRFFESEGATIYLWFCLLLTYFSIGLFLVSKRFYINKKTTKPPLLDILT